MFEIVKTASAREVDAILHAVYQENPKFWAAGLTRDHFDGGLWLIRKQASREAIGFTGWQIRDEGLKKVGYYSIGVLPAYRGCGVAREAVSRMLREKSAEVDVVRALVHPDNQPSLNLADRLGVEVEKAAMVRKGLGTAAAAVKHQLASILAGGASTTVLHDQIMDPSRSLGSSFQPWNWDKDRLLQGVVNFGMGNLGGGLMHSSLARKATKATAASPAVRARPFSASKLNGGVGLMATGPIVKDLAMHANKGIEAVDQIAKRPEAKPAMSTAEKVIAGLLAATGIGAATYAANRIGDSADSVARASGPRARVTLATRDPGDGETTLEVPMPDVNLSQNILTGLHRDLRGRLRQENKERVGKFRKSQVQMKNLGVTLTDAGEVLNGKEDQVPLLPAA